ncbi:MAG TPA: phosphotransferase, partial [Clostridia bacterium]|nr:phosphotransferase [Clostridia bacterium]
MNNAENIAAGIAANHGLDLHTLTRGGGWTNAVFLSDVLVIRVSPDPGSNRIGREVALAQWLPPQAGYPEVIEYGRTEGHEWSVSRRIPGETLSDAWPSLNWTQKTEILRQIWDIAEAIHRVDIQPLRATLPQRAWYSSLEKRESLGLLETLVQKGLLSRDQV